MVEKPNPQLHHIRRYEMRLRIGSSFRSDPTTCYLKLSRFRRMVSSPSRPVFAAHVCGVRQDLRIATLAALASNPRGDRSDRPLLPGWQPVSPCWIFRSSFIGYRVRPRPFAACPLALISGSLRPPVSRPVAYSELLDPGVRSGCSGLCPLLPASSPAAVGFGWAAGLYRLLFPDPPAVKDLMQENNTPL